MTSEEFIRHRGKYNKRFFGKARRKRKNKVHNILNSNNI